MRLVCQIHDRKILLGVDKTTKWVGLKITVDDLYVTYVGVRTSGYSRPSFGRKQGVSDQILHLKQLSKIHGNDTPSYHPDPSIHAYKLAKISQRVK